MTVTASGTAQGGTSGTIQLAASTTYVDNIPQGQTIAITAGTGAGQARLITWFTGSTDTASISPAWITTPDATSVYEIESCGPSDVVAWKSASVPYPGTSGVPQVDVVSVVNNGNAAWGLSSVYAVAMVRGDNLGAGATSTTIDLTGSINLPASASANDGVLVGRLLVISGGTGLGQARIIRAYDGTTQVATIDPLEVTPDATSDVLVMTNGPASTTPPHLTIGN